MNNSLEVTNDSNQEISLDLTPFNEPVIFSIEKTGLGFMAKSKIHINYRWDTACEWLESNRMFGHKQPFDFNKECVKSIADIMEKRLFVFKANHGLLDREGEGVSGTIRFRR